MQGRSPLAPTTPSTPAPKPPGSPAQTGQAALEMLLVLLILVPLLFGGIELARGVGIRHSLDSGVGVAARAISLDPSQWSWATQVIEDSVTNNVLGGGTASPPTVQVFNDAGTELTSGQLAALGFGETFRLQAETTYTPWLPLVTGGGQAIAIRVSHWGIVEQYP
ncbi:MAG: pilus assembly protein [Chloroflexi bacterium]|nr:pilus assembly protein [Chloroflexota bacterium]